MKKQTWIIVLAAICALCCFAAILTACENNKPNIEDDKVQYTYRNPDAVLPDYDTDVITVDGKLEETVYNTLRWWEAEYPEDDGVNVRATSYAGEKGIFFIFDVDDYAVNVNPLRASYENSGVTIYVAKSDARTLNDGVWEIELCPDNSINAKCAIGGYHYSTIQPDGFKNKPFVRTVTKGGAVNTDECCGYVMESYFSYEYLFGSEAKPNGYRINYSLQRNSNLDKTHDRDTYYNFGEHLLGAYNWNAPSTWWSFNDNGVDSVIISTSVTGEGKIEFADKFVSRYGTTSAFVIPAEGHRIKRVLFSGKDVTSQLRYADGLNTLKLRNLSEDCSISAEFEVVPDGQSTVSGNVMFLGSALTASQAEDLQVLINIGGVVYCSDVASNGSYSVTSANGSGVLEVVSKRGYSVKRESIEVSASKTQNIALTEADYGSNRVVAFDDEAVITSKVKLFDATNYLDTMNGTFTYAFTLKYSGTLLDGSGAAVDPTEGQYEHQYTSINLFTSLKNADNNSEYLHLQLLRWDGQWMLKAAMGDKNKSNAVDNELLRALGSEDGVNMLMAFDDNGVSFYRTDKRGGVTQKLLEIGFVTDWGMTAKERKVTSIEFYCENVVNHNIWSVQNNAISLGKTIGDYTVYQYLYNATATLNADTNSLKDALGLAWDINHGAVTGSLVDSFKIKTGNVSGQGVVSKDEQIVLIMLGCDEWSNRLNATLHLKKDGGSYIGINLGPVTDTYHRYVLSDAQMKALGGDGLNIYLVQSTDNTTYGLYVADGNNLAHVRDIESDGKGKAYGYEVNYYGTDTVSAETSAFAGETADKLLERINAYTNTEYTQITEGAITEIVELINNTVLSGTYTEAHSGDKGTVISTGEWDRGNSVWHYSAEVSNFFTDCAISDGMTIKFNHFGTNEWGLNYWAYNVIFTLDAAENKAKIEFQEGTNWSVSAYELTADELSAIAASGRLDFYAVRNNANKLTLCIGNTDGTIKITSLVMDTAAKFGVAKLKVETLTYGAAITVNCHNYYADYNFDVSKSAQELISATCANDVAPDKVRYVVHVEAVAPGHTAAGNIEYWTCDGKYYSDAEATVEISQDDTVIGPAGHSYDTAKWEFDLTHHWHICPDDKAQSEHVAHTPDASGNCAECGARPLDLDKFHKVEASDATCTEDGNTEYWTDGYYYFEDEAHTKATSLSQVTLDKISHSLGNYVSDGNRHYKQCSVCHEKFYSEHEFTDGQCECGIYEELTYKLLQTKSYTATGNSGEWMSVWDDGNSIWHFGVGLSHFLDANGKVIKDCEVKVAMKSDYSDWSDYYQNNLIVRANAAANTVTLTFQSSGNDWGEVTHTLTDGQRAAIGADRVLHAYALHTEFGNGHEVILCVREGNGIVATQVKMTTQSVAKYQTHNVETLTADASLAVDIVNFGTAGKKYKHSVEMLISGAADKFTAPVRVLKFVQGTAATCTENGVNDYYTDGIKIYKDAVGNEELQTTVITALGHDFDNTRYQTNAMYHWHGCTRCDAKQGEEAHTWLNGECSVCHAEQKAPENLTDFPAKEATCTTPGNIACKTDGTDYWTAEGQWLSKEQVFTTPALGHDYKILTSEVEHYKKCARCGDEVESFRGNHSFDNGVCECGEKVQSKVKVFSANKAETYGGYDDDNAPYTRFGGNNGYDTILSRFIVKAPDAFGDDGKIKSAATLTMEFKGCNGWWKYFGIRLSLSGNGGVVAFKSHNGDDGDVYLDTDYSLTEYQLNALKENGLEFYIETEGAKRVVYVQTSDSELACISIFYTPGNDSTVRNFRISYAQAAYGAEVKFDVVDRNWAEACAVIENSFGKSYTVKFGEWSSSAQNGYVKTDDIGSRKGNTFIHFNVKLDKQLADGECLVFKYQGWISNSYGVCIRLKYDGAAYGLANSSKWEGETFSGNGLSADWASKLTADTGLDFFLVQHGTDNFMTMYASDGNDVVEVCKTCAETYNPFIAEAVLNANENDGEYNGAANATITADWYSYPSDVTAENAIKNYFKA